MLKWIIVILIGIAVFLFLVLIASIIAKAIFIQNARKEVASLFKDTHEKKKEKLIDKKDLMNLPYPVKNWLINSNIIGKKKIATVRLKQQGQMRTNKNGPWMWSTAEQYFKVEEPGFVWKANVKMTPFIHLAGIDTFNGREGKMWIKLLSLFPIVNAKGPEIDLSTMMRYLAEMPWFPTAALNPYIIWEEIDEKKARATFNHNGLSVSGVFYFNQHGDISRFMGKRYREVKGNFILSDWGGIYKEFKEFEGIRIPSKSDIIWVKEDEVFKWFECEITDVNYNIPLHY